MIIPEEHKEKLKYAAQQIEDAAQALNLPALCEKAAELDRIREQPDFYKNQSRAAQINAQAKNIQDTVSNATQLATQAKNLEELIELLEHEDDARLLEDFAKELDVLCAGAEALHLATLFKGEYDGGNAILSLHAGAGGTEAQDWVQMLYRMYRMFAEKNGYQIEVIDELSGEEAGIKSITFFVKGVNAYGYLKAERGVHRLVRISPFDSNARRHTSFASLEVMPELDNNVDIKINPEDLRIDTYRSGGAGGQHVNKTESAIRITHIPTGIVAACQNERSQIQNRETAMKMLKGKLVELKEREAQEKNAALKGEVKKIEWGSQIRSYVFQPYTMVKDHRTNFECPDVRAVMDGNIADFMIDYLKKVNC